MSINIKKIIVSFTFQHKAYLFLKRLHKLFPSSTELCYVCKTVVGNFLYMRGDCHGIENVWHEIMDSIHETVCLMFPVYVHQGFAL